MRTTTRSLLKIGFLVGLIVLVGVVAARGEATGSTFATGYGTGGLELKIDNETYYNGELQPKLSWELKNLRPWKDKFFWFKDVKPGDTGTTTVSIHLRKNSAWVCLDFQRLRDSENGENEPESHEDGEAGGELSGELEFFAWLDDGDNTFELGEKPLFGTSTQAAKEVLKGQSYAIADSTTGQPIFPNQTKYVGINWCAGNLEVDVDNAEVTCDGGAMGNESQTDIMTLAVSLRAVSARLLPKYTCVKSLHPGWPPKDDDENDEDEDDDEEGNGEVGGDDNHHDNEYTNEWNAVNPNHERSVRAEITHRVGDFFNRFRLRNRS